MRENIAELKSGKEVYWCLRKKLEGRLQEGYIVVSPSELKIGSVKREGMVLIRKNITEPKVKKEKVNANTSKK